MKIFITKFIWDGDEYTGPDIHASNHANAELIAEAQGLILEGELQSIVQLEDLDDINRPRVLH
jgi:hypothetical protein|tara:strand:- start:548 stop:736 length:189 start_codon:yes stop_codon:yes gene_type:complete